MGITGGSQGLHITIGTSPGSREIQSMLTHDIRLAKAAVLYADRAKLVSFSSTVMTYFAAMAHGPGELRHSELKDVLRVVAAPRDQRIAKLIDESDKIGERLERGQYVPAKTRQLYHQLQPELERLTDELEQLYKRLLEEAGTAELEAAIDAGLLEVQPLEGLEGIDSDQWVTVYIEQLNGILTDPAAYPLFDELIGDVVRHGIHEGMFNITSGSEARGRRSALAANLLERLPLFEQATMDEIIHIRRELERPLRRFRSAVSEFSDQIARAAWDPDFVFDAQDTFDKLVAPTVDDVNESIQANRLLTHILNRAMEKPAALPIIAGGLSLAMTPAIPDLVAASAVASGGLSVAWPAIRTWSERWREIEKNDLFFYYKAGKLLTADTKS